MSEVAEFVRGITFRPDDVVPFGTTGSVVCMRTKNVQKELDISDVWSVSESFIKRSNQLLQAGDILTSSANSWNLVGKCCWIPQLQWAASFGGFVSVLRAHAKEVDPRFLFRWFSSDQVQSIVRSYGRQTTNISNLDIGRCLRLELPLPSLVEQRQIAALLDRVDAMRATRREALTQLDNLINAIFVDIFGDPASNPKGWPTAPVGEVARIQTGLQVTGTRKSRPIEVPYLRVANVYRQNLDLSYIKLMRVTQGELARTRLQRDDLLIVEGHGNSTEVGRSSLWDGSIEDCVHQNHLIRARFDGELIHPVYASVYLNTPSGNRYLLKSAKTTSGLNTINVSNVRSTPIGLPPLQLQHEFARQIELVERLRASHRVHLGELDALFASLQHRAFRGEL